MLELDRVGEKSPGDKYELSLTNEEKYRRVTALCDAVQNLWTVGRQSRFLTDVSPKFVCAALLKVKNPVFLESIRISDDGNVNEELIENTISDNSSQIISYVIGERKGFFPKDNDKYVSLGKCFEIIKGWIRDVYSV